MSDEQPAAVDHVRVFMVDQTSYDAVLSVPWSVFIDTVVRHGCVVTNDVLINRSAIVRIMRFTPGMDVPRETAQVIDFPTPKGTA